MLAERLTEYKAGGRGVEGGVVVLAVPRGGVVVAYEVAKSLGAPMDLIIPRKLGAPYNPELAIGAVAQDGTVVLNEDVVSQLGVTQDYIRREAEAQVREIQRRMKKYRGDRPYPSLAGKTVILVDDGIATGATIRAAVRSIRGQGPRSLVIAVPVAPPGTVRALAREADRVVVLDTPEFFLAIGQFYQNFEQTSDEEVIDLLRKAGSGGQPAARV